MRKLGLGLMFGFCGIVSFAQAEETDLKDPPRDSKLDNGSLDGPSTGNEAKNVPEQKKDGAIPKKSKDGIFVYEVPLRSLLKTRFHPAVFPDEAAARCSTNEQCLFSFAYGLTVGADLLRMAWTPLFENATNRDGNWAHFNVSGGFQILNNAEDVYYANILVGYRFSKMEDSTKNYFSTDAVWAQLSYAQELRHYGSIGITVKGDLNRNSRATHKERFLEQDSFGFRESLNGFHEFQRKDPLLGVNFLWDMELYNWNGEGLNWPEHLRLFSHVEPYYFHVETAVDDMRWTERIVGIKVNPLLSYESKKDRKFGRYALAAGLGLDIGGGVGTLSPGRYIPQRGQHKLAATDFSTRSLLGIYADFRGSFQF